MKRNRISQDDYFALRTFFVGLGAEILWEKTAKELSDLVWDEQVIESHVSETTICRTRLETFPITQTDTETGSNRATDDA